MPPSAFQRLKQHSSNLSSAERSEVLARAERLKAWASSDAVNDDQRAYFGWRKSDSRLIAQEGSTLDFRWPLSRSILWGENDECWELTVMCSYASDFVWVGAEYSKRKPTNKEAKKKKGRRPMLTLPSPVPHNLVPTALEVLTGERGIMAKWIGSGGPKQMGQPWVLPLKYALLPRPMVYFGIYPERGTIRFGVSSLPVTKLGVLRGELLGVTTAKWEKVTDALGGNEIEATDTALKKVAQFTLGYTKELLAL